jgi:hypothetical protein
MKQVAVAQRSHWQSVADRSGPDTFPTVSTRPVNKEQGNAQPTHGDTHLLSAPVSFSMQKFLKSRIINFPDLQRQLLISNKFNESGQTPVKYT